MLKKRKRLFYYNKNYSNPFFRQRKRNVFRNLPGKFSWRFKLIFLLILAIIITIIWFLFFFSQFDIKIIEIEGNKRISADEISDFTWKQTKEKRFLFGSQKNLNLFNEDEFSDSLKEKYNFNDVAIKKRPFHKIIVRIEEKNCSLIWYEEEKYYYIDSDGYVISGANPLEINQKDYPLVENKGNLIISEKRVKIKKEDIEYIVKLFQEFKNNLKNFNIGEGQTFEIDRFIVDNDIDTAKIALINGPIIYFNTSADMNEQINKLTAFISQTLKNNLKNIKIIKLKYGDRIYYE